MKEEKKKTSVVIWIALGFILLFIIIGVIGVIGEKGEVGPAQVSQPTEEKVPLSIDRNYYIITTDNNFTVNGTTSPIAKVMVNEKEVRVNEQGGFSTIMPLELGENLIKITAETGEDENNAGIRIERITQEEKDRRKAESEKKSILEITAEEIYSNYIKCQTDPSVEDLVWKKYDGKVVEVTGIVLRATDYFSRDSVFEGVSEETAEEILEIRKETIEKDKRCLIQLTCKNCLDEDGERGYVAWVYSSFPRLIEGIKKGDKITVTGQWQYVVGSTCGIPDLMNSEIKKIY